MHYITGTLLRKAFEKKEQILALDESVNKEIEIWKHLMLKPLDYSYAAIHNAETRSIMQKVHVEHGGPQFDELYPEGIPTSVQLKTKHTKFESGVVNFPLGHATNEDEGLYETLMHKFKRLGQLAMSSEELTRFVRDLENI